VVDIDQIGTFHVMRAVYPHLAKPGAAVINITAPQSFVPMRYQAKVRAVLLGGHSGGAERAAHHS
jgi:hypothetical protein